MGDAAERTSALPDLPRFASVKGSEVSRWQGEGGNHDDGSQYRTGAAAVRNERRDVFVTLPPFPKRWVASGLWCRVLKWADGNALPLTQSSEVRLELHRISQFGRGRIRSRGHY
jgi:hypothetical protein